MPAIYEVGVALHLPDAKDEHPMGLCRDELLFHLVDRVAKQGIHDDPYELREVLSADLPMASGSDADVGDLVVIARSDNVGGPMAPAKAAPILAELEALGPRGELFEPLGQLVSAERAFLLPPWVLPTTGEFAADHIFHGVEFRGQADVLRLVQTDPLPDELAHFCRLLAFCRDNRFVISFRRS